MGAVRARSWPDLLLTAAPLHRHPCRFGREPPHPRPKLSTAARSNEPTIAMATRRPARRTWRAKTLCAYGNQGVTTAVTCRHARTCLVRRCGSVVVRPAPCLGPQERSGALSPAGGLLMWRHEQRPTPARRGRSAGLTRCRACWTAGALTTEVPCRSRERVVPRPAAVSLPLASLASQLAGRAGAVASRDADDRS